MDLKRFLLILRARRMTVLLTFLATVVVAVAVTLLLPKRYDAEAVVVINAKYVDPVTGAQMQGMLLPEYLSTQADIIASPTTALRVVTALGLDRDPTMQDKFRSATGGVGNIDDWLAGLLLKGLKVKASDQSSDISISFPAPDARQSADLTNAFLDGYIATTVDLKTQPARQTADWYQSQIKAMRAHLEETQAKLADFQSKYGVVLNPADDASPAAAQAMAAQDAVARATSISDATRTGGTGSDSMDVMRDPVVQTLKSNLADAESKLSQLASTEGPNNPEYRAAQAAVTSLQAKLNSQIAVVHASLVRAAAASRQSAAALHAAVSTEKRGVVQDQALKGQGQILLSDMQDAQHMYDTAWANYQQSLLTSKTDQTDVAVLNRATPPSSAAWPKMWLNLVVAVFFGAVLGVAYAVLLEFRSRKVRCEEDLFDAAGIPLLAVVDAHPMPMLTSR